MFTSVQKKIRLVASFVAAFIIGGGVNAQIALQYNDTTVCPGETIQMCAAFSGQASTLSTDDDFTAILDIGFPFVFFGNTYTQCVMSDNGFLSFQTNYANLYSAFTWNAASPVEATNAIIPAFQDGFLPAGGKLRYQYFGTPGSRRFIAEWCSVPKYGGSCNAFTFTTQVILYEGSNVIEIHTTSLPGTPACPSTNGAGSGGNGVQGVRNVGGTINFYTPGRAPADFWGTVGATNDGRRFTSNGINTYLIDTIPFNPWVIIDQASAADLKWYTSLQPNVPIATGACATVTTQANIPYYLVKYEGGAGCNGGFQSFVDTVFINFGTAYDTTQAEICSGTTYNFFGRELFAAGNYDTLLKTTMGCDSFLRLQLVVNPLPKTAIRGSWNVEICQGSSTFLSLAEEESGITYQWYRNDIAMAGETGYRVSVTLPGDYYVEATTAKGCKAKSEKFLVKVNPNPVAAIKPMNDEIACAYDTIKIAAVPGAGFEYRWSPEKPFRFHGGYESEEVKGVFIEPTNTVTLTVFNEYGCFDTASIIVNTKPCCEIFTPNAFTPNADGSNDFFNPYLQPGQILVSLQVFDRYGKMVYNNENMKKGWDGLYPNGTAAANDVYVYYMKYTCADGVLYSKKGDITLIR